MRQITSFLRAAAASLLVASLTACVPQPPRDTVAATAADGATTSDAATMRPLPPPAATPPGTTGSNPLADRIKPPPPMSEPLPPERVDEATGTQLVTSCKTDADCTVKDVGNCCGAMPACVNVASPTNPAAVQAECKRKGMMSACGFREISACQCVQGTCRAAGDEAVAR